MAPGALRALVEAHDQGCAIVAGDSANLMQSAIGWASYFDGSEHCSFAREPLLRLDGFDERVIEGAEALARDRLISRGQRSAHTPLVTFGRRTELTTSRDYVSQRCALGRATADLARMVARDCRRVAPTWRGLHGASPDAAGHSSVSGRWYSAVARQQATAEEDLGSRAAVARLAAKQVIQAPGRDTPRTLSRGAPVARAGSGAVERNRSAQRRTWCAGR